MAELIPGGRTVGRIFRRFHALVAETVERLETEPWPADGPIDLAALRAPLLAEIALIQEELGEDPPADPAVVRQVLFLLAVHADDRAMAARWPRPDAWADQRIETELYGSAVGAAEVESRCRRLLEVPTPENRQLARLFLYAFGLGLGAGSEADAERLTALRRSLLEFARPTRQPATGGRRRLFRQAYRYTAARGERRLLPDFRGWLALAAVLLAVLVLLSMPAWWGAVEGVSEALVSPSGGSVSAPAEPAPAPGPPEARPSGTAPPAAGGSDGSPPAAGESDGSPAAADEAEEAGEAEA